MASECYDGGMQRSQEKKYGAVLGHSQKRINEQVDNVKLTMLSRCLRVKEWKRLNRSIRCFPC